MTMRTAACGALIIAFAARAAAGQTGDLARNVGEHACLSCHDVDGAGHLCSLETIPEHRRSFFALRKLKAKDIAALSGVPDDPTESRICLGCHATGADAGPRWFDYSFNLQDGVQCEACHGPGSLHVERYCDAQAADPRGTPEDAGADGRSDALLASLLHERTADATSPESDAALVRPLLGLLELRDVAHGALILPGSRDDCGICHSQRLSHQWVLKEGYRLKPADGHYKNPVNLTISPDGARIYVVCEQGNSVQIVDRRLQRVINEIPVGKRPHDACLSPDGSKLYVSNRLSDTVSVIDTNQAKVVAEKRVGAEPHALYADPTGARLFVLNTSDNAVMVLDAATLAPIKRLEAGRGPWGLAESLDGELLYATNVRPNLGAFREPPRSEITVIDVARAIVVSRAIVRDANMLEGIDFITGRNVALFVTMRTKNLVPITRLAQGWVITNGLGVLWPDGRVDQVLLDEPGHYFPDATDVAVSPDGRTALVTSGGANEVAVVDVDALLDLIASATDHEREEVLPNHLGLSGRFVKKRIGVGIGPRAVAFSPDGRFAYVANTLSDSLSVIDAESYELVGAIDLGGPDETTEIRRGERLFHDASNAFGRQFSCRSCHPDGHVNGLTHDIEADGIGSKPVDNRTLRGILDTAPFKWEGTNPSLHRQCGARLAVFFTRLEPFTPEELDALVRYMCTIERPPNPNREPDGLTLSQRRGRAVFERTVTNSGRPIEPEKRCTTCHRGSYHTTREMAWVGSAMWFDVPQNVARKLNYDVDAFGDLGTVYLYDLGDRSEFDVPHLTNIYNGAPYYHNGAARTLVEIWTRFNIFEWHAATNDLTRQQLNDLIAYLKSL